MVCFTFFRPRLFDDDNSRGGAKGLLDAVRRNGLIRDDSVAAIDTEYRQEKCKKGEEKTVIEIWEYL